MSRWLAVAAAGEAIAGLALLLSPSRVVPLLFGGQIEGVGIVVSRVAGMALAALRIACWPGVDERAAASGLSGMLTYSVLAALYLAQLGLGGASRGGLLWPAAVVHLILAVALALAWSRRASAVG
jgi:hypothetical protein